MNLKQFFYRDYYNGVNLMKYAGENGIQSKADKDSNDSAKNLNEPQFKTANKKLTDFMLKPEATTSLDFSRWNKQVKTIELETTYPGLFTGSGYNHETGNVGELKLGFFFDHSTGLPILPGSSVKGTLRSFFPRFKADPNDALKFRSGDETPLQKNKSALIAFLFELDDPNDQEAVFKLESALFEGVDFVETERKRAELRTQGAKEVENTICYKPMSQHAVFLDAFISKPGERGRILGTDAITPHGQNPLKNPIPLPFLKILPGVTFKFQFILHDIELSNTKKISAAKIQEVFETLLSDFGIGAKTNVGYGQFKSKRTAAATGATTAVQGVSQVAVAKKTPLRKGEKPGGTVVESDRSGYVAIQLNTDPEVVAYLKFPEREIGISVKEVEILELKPELKIRVNRWS